MSYHQRHYLSYKYKSLRKQFLIIFFLCLIAAFILSFLVVKGRDINAQFAADKRQIEAERFGARDYINYGGSLKR